MKEETQKQLTFEQYLTFLTQRLECYFTIQNNYTLDGVKFDFSAEYNSREDQTFLSKSQVMDYVETKELCLAVRISDVEAINNVLEKLPEIALKYTGGLSRHHKSTIVTVAFVEDAGCTEEEVRAIKRFHFHKTHRFGFYGMTSAFAVLVDLETSRIYCGRGASYKKKVYIPVEKSGSK